LQAAEKGFVSFERLEKHTSGAEAHVDLIGFMPGINPRPTARTSFPRPAPVLEARNVSPNPVQRRNVPISARFTHSIVWLPAFQGSRAKSNSQNRIKRFSEITDVEKENPTCFTLLTNRRRLKALLAVFVCRSLMETFPGNLGSLD
jgi:hypothetical protein